MTILRRLFEFATGSAIGVLVGLIAGLSISPITSMVLGALSTGLLILLGLTEPKGSENSENRTTRILGFGLACSFALVLGIYLRTHQVLSPPLETQKERLTATKVFTEEQISEILLSTNFGIHPTANSPNSPSGTGAAADLASATLLRSGSEDFCRVAKRDQFHDLAAYLDELKRRDAKLAHIIESAPKNYQDSLSKSLSDYRCP